ncbi:hypothetical protein SEPCBS57363_002827 [Sporothrix epigloea]|uniref:Uncharacterized protein n=1 Tax=Sporothrix epigloea TaxID=1892477 RepID=A0ABP0DI27_9PEZI
MAVGYHVFHQRNQLRNLTLSNQAKDLSSFEVKDSPDKNLNSRVYGTVTTEVQITRDVCESALRCERTPPKTPLGSSMQCPWTEETFPLHSERMDEESTGEAAFYTPANHDFHSDTSTVYRATSTTIITSPSPSYGFVPIIQDQPPSMHRSCHFDTALSTYRLQQGFSRAPRPHFHCTSTSNTGKSSRSSAPLGDRISGGWQHFFGKLQHMDPVKLAYLRTSFVFAISVLVTWAPSSINRVYTLVHPARNSYGLNIASAAVLPLQGVWNAVIYFSTSWNLLRQETSQAYAQWTCFQIFSHRRNKTNGILVDGLVTHQATTIVPSPVLSPARTHSASRTHMNLTEGGDDTESDGFEGLGLFESSRPDYLPGNCRLWPTAGIDLNAFTRSNPRNPYKAPRRGNLRIQRGGQLDS